MKKKDSYKKWAHLINKLYALSIIIDGLAKDLSRDDISESAKKLRRAGVDGTAVEEAFGQFADDVEAELLKFQINNEILMYNLCYCSYTLASKIESTFRTIDPFFNFYQWAEIKELKAYSEGKTDKEVLEIINISLKKFL